MIDTTSQSTNVSSEKPKPLLKLGRKKIGAPRQSQEENQEDQQTAASALKDEQCPFKQCGRKFVSEPELKQHMQRRHRPTE